MTTIEHLHHVAPAATQIALAFADWRALQETLIADQIPEAALLATVTAAGQRIREIEALPAQTADDVWMKVLVAMGDASDLQGDLPDLTATALSALGLNAVDLWGVPEAA